jgi:cell division protein FtsI (penicillin-binding protein 3)
MLAGVVESEHGTGGAAAVPGYRVGGKTGTAKKPLNGGYEDGAYFASFAGFAPVDDPRYVVAVMVDEPREGSYYGGTVAAPVFSDLMGFVLGHERVPPSSEAEPPTPQAVPSPTPQATTTPPAP